jgi:asparagine synthase (glutamine-hydrolysing)
MCGICGFNWDDLSLVRSMCSSLRHRGPDDSGTYNDQFVSLGHQRLSIIDLSLKGKQPISNEDGSIVITFNGEIYNYKKLRYLLEQKNHTFQTETDTEVIVHGYEEWGEKVLNKLEGMFAFAIWDSNKKELFLARDRLGIKPLYYYHDGKKFIFSSEMKAFLKHPLTFSLHKKTLNQFFTYAYSVNNETLLQNVYDLLPGTFLVYKNNTVTIKHYWELRSTVDQQPLDYYVKRLRALLSDSVKNRLMSDVPLGVSLSGGIDSSFIVALMSTLSDAEVNTFTVGFGDASDEFKQAKIVADHCGTNHTEKIISYDDLSSAFPQIVWHMESPFGRPSVLPTYLLSQEIKKDVTVNLVGEGSDELFAGYNRYYPYTKQPSFSLSYLFNKNAFLFYKGFAKYKYMSAEERVNSICSGYFTDETERTSAYSKKLLDFASPQLKPLETFGSYFNSSTGTVEGINSALLFELKTELTGVQLNRVDRMSMAHGVEMRVPFLDHHLVEFAMNIPSKYKWHGVQKKYVLQKAAQGFLPPCIVKRKKLPFHIPLDSYARNNFFEVAESVLLNTSHKIDFIRYPYFEKLIEKIKSGDVVQNNSLRQLLFTTSFELWHRLFIDRIPVQKLTV